MSMPKYQYITTSCRDRVLTVTLDRPEKLNAINSTLHAELAQVFYDAARDADSDVVVLTGAGKAFCAGGDVEYLQEMIDGGTRGFELCRMDAKRIVFSILDLEKPLIAKVNGHAMGLGATIALLSDIIIAAESAKIGDPHVSIGFSAGDGGAGGFVGDTEAGRGSAVSAAPGCGQTIAGFFWSADAGFSVGLTGSLSASGFSTGGGLSGGIVGP